MKKAIVLLSGGMDSAVTLYIARQGYECVALIFDYGQKAAREIECARKLSREAGCEFFVLDISLPWKGSSLLDETMEIKAASGGTIPDTYVPARNIIFLSYALSSAEAIKADAVFIGAHQLDYSNYPDCRGEFFDAFRAVVRTGTKTGTGAKPVDIVTPILNSTKVEILKKGMDLGVPFEYTWSCYSGGEEPCGVCESCVFRVDAFKQAGIEDPALRSVALLKKRKRFKRIAANRVEG